METLGKRVRSFRMAKNLSQLEVAEKMRMSRPTYNAVELGMRQLTISEVQVLAGILDVPLENILHADSSQSLFDVSLTKYKQMILNCLQWGGDSSDGKLTKTKLAKLVYLVDFAWFFMHHTSMSGQLYRRIQQGPVPDQYFRAVDELFGASAITIQPNGTALMIKPNESNAPRNKLSDAEVDLIQIIAKKWKDKNTQDIVDFTHGQTPWLSCRQGELVPYELILHESGSNLY